MTERKNELRRPLGDFERPLEFLARHWKWVTVLAWLALSAWYLWDRWAMIQAFALQDTDDNLRMAQVRALLAGQDWYDLRQYRLNPPNGADVHWSRLVDLPIAGLILLLRPVLGGAEAERVAVAIAPLLAMLPLLFGLALTIRRLVDRRAYPLAFVAFYFAGSASGMFLPLRIDHHGWQLALLSLAVAGISDPKRARGGATLGVASALSLTIGLELLIYLALAAGAMVLFWVLDTGERRRLAAYGVALSGATAAGFIGFASYANRQPVCDALSPVWLSNALLGGALVVVLAVLSPGDWKRRLALAAAAGVAVALFHAFAWPHCLSRLEGVSPEVEQLWLSHVREARPLYTHGWRIALVVATLPVMGLIGWALLAWTARREPVRFRSTVAAALPLTAATLLLLWQTRTGPAAQMLAIPGAAALVWLVVPAIARLRLPIVPLLAVSALILVALGPAVPLALRWVPRDPPTERDRAIGKANAGCNSFAGLRGVAQVPKGMVFSFIDNGPRLIVGTHHNAVIGPYHRNGEQIADVMKAFRGSAENARAILRKYDADYLLVCPNSSTTTIFMSKAPKGFYAQLQRGDVPSWLTPVALPKDSPFRMWRVAD